MLASHHETLSQTAPSEASSMSPLLDAHVELIIYAASSTVQSTSSEPSSSKDKPKKEPVTSRDHLDTSADLMTDIQVETYSSMDKREKTDL